MTAERREQRATWERHFLSVIATLTVSAILWVGVNVQSNAVVAATISTRLQGLQVVISDLSDDINGIDNNAQSVAVLQSRVKSLETEVYELRKRMEHGNSK